MIQAANDPRLVPLALRRELLASGYDDRQLAAGLRSGLFARARRGAYVDGPTWARLSTEQRYVLRSRAVVRQAATGVALSHVSALPFHGAPLVGHLLTDVHVTRIDGRTGRAEAGVRQHRGRLLEGDVVDVLGTPVTSPVRALIECAAVSSTEATLVAANDLLHRGVVDLAELRRRSEEEMDHWPGSLTTRIVVRLADHRIATPGESRTSFFFHAAGLPQPIPQFEVKDDDGFRALLDFAIPELGVWFEFDGRGKYVDFLRPGETVADVVLREKRREDRVRELTGWRCMRITWEDLADPAGLAVRVRAFLAGSSRAA